MAERIVLLTGGSGFIGNRISLLMTQAGWKPRLLSRKEPPGHSEMEWVQGDIRDPVACDRAIVGAEAVIHAAGEKNQKDDMHAVNVEGTSNLLKAALKNDVKRFVHISSVGVIGAHPLQKRVLDENVTCRPNNEYEKSKWLAEEKVKEASAMGLKSVIVRPTNVFGDRDPSKGLLSLAQSIRDGRFAFLGGRDSTCNFIFVEDVARAVLAMVEHDGNVEGVYHVSDPCSLGEFVDAMADELCVGRPTINVPDVCSQSLRMLLRFSYHLPFVSQLPIFSRLIALNNQAVFISARLQSERGFNNPVGWRQGVKRLVQWYRGQGEL